VSLVEIVEAIDVELIARGCPCPIKLGEQYVADNSGPRYVVVPDTGDTFADPLVSAPEYFVGTREDAQLTPRPIFTRTMGFRVNIWGYADGYQTEDQRARDQQYLELMLTVLIASIRKVSQGVARFVSGAQDCAKAIHDRHGLMYDLHVQIDVPVRDIAWDESGFAMATLESVPATVETLLGDTEPQTYQAGPVFTATGS
jgi:hypothetical protein